MKVSFHYLGSVTYLQQDRMRVRGKAKVKRPREGKKSEEIQLNFMMSRENKKEKSKSLNEGSYPGACS